METLSGREEIRDINRQTLTNPTQIKQSKSQSNRQQLEKAIEEAFNSGEYNLKRFVNSLMAEAVDRHQVAAYQEILNRYAGKVKDTLDINVNIKDLRPSQEEISQLDAQFRPSSIQASTDKTLPDASNAEQQAIIDADYTIIPDNTQDMGHNPCYRQSIEAEINQSNKTDTFPVDCSIIPDTDNILQGQDTHDEYSNKPHIIHHNRSLR